MLPAKTTANAAAFASFGPLALLGFPLALLGLFGSYFDCSACAKEIASYPEATRWVARIVSAAVYILWAALHGLGRAPRPTVPLLTCTAVALAGGVLGTLFASHGCAAFVFFQVLVGLSNPVVLLLCADALSRVPSGHRVGAVVMGGIVATIVSFAFKVLPEASAGIFLATALVSATTPFAMLRAGMLEPVRDGVSSCPPRFPIGWELLLLAVCYSLMFRILGTLGFSMPILSPVIRVVFTTAVLGAVAISATRGVFSPRTAVAWLFVPALSGLVLVPFADGSLLAIAHSVASSCWPLFYYLFWIVLLETGRGPNDRMLSFSCG